MAIEIPEGARTAGPASAATPKTSPGWWQRYLDNRRRYRASPGFKPMRPPGWGTAKFLTKVPLGAAKWLGTGMTGAVGGALMPTPMFPGERPVATTEQEFAPTGLEGLPISHMEETFSPRAGEYTPSYEPYTRPATYGVPGYDEDFLNNIRQQQELQGAIRERDEAELAGKEDLSMRESIVMGIGNSWDRIKDAIAGRETTPETVTPAIAYDISQMTGKKADAIATGTTKVNEQQMVTRTDSMWDRIMMLMGDTGGGIDWKDAEKTYGMLAAGGILSGQGTGIANSFFGNVMGMARMQNDQKWRISQLATMPRKTYYPVIPEGNALRLDPTRDILNLHPLDDIPPMYSESKPAESATNSRIIESKEGRKRLDGSDGLRGLWEFKIQTADDTGMGKDWLGMGAEIAAIYTSKYPKLIDMRVMPYTDEMVEMIRTLKGRTSEAAIASGDLEKENWDYWRDTFGNWLPHPSMLKLTAADFGY